MRTRDYRDIWGGGIIVVIGVLVATHAVTTLNLGTLSRMGPGMVPTATGVILIALGAGILLSGWFRAGEMPSLDVRSLAAVLGSILAFAVLVVPFGLIPAVVGLTLVASWADNKLSLGKAFLLGLALALAAFLIFRVGLDAQLELLDWPW